MAAEPVFVDTNVLVYSSRATAIHNLQARVRLAELEDSLCPLWISWQVLREFLAVVTRAQPNHPAMDLAQAVEYVAKLQQTFAIAPETQSVFARLTSLLATIPSAGKQIHDTNLVATMLEAGIHRLLTFNQRDFRRFAGHIELIDP